MPITEVREWGDAGLAELIRPYTEAPHDRLMMNMLNIHGRGGEGEEDIGEEGGNGVRISNVR